MFGYVFVKIDNYYIFCHGLLVGFGADLVVVNSQVIVIKSRGRIIALQTIFPDCIYTSSFFCLHVLCSAVILKACLV
jgi:hypothetical protein